MKLKMLVIGLLVGMLLIAGSAMAQDTTETLCGADFFTSPAPDGKSIIDVLAGEVELLKTTAASGDVKLLLKQTSDLRLALGLLDAQCRGLHFTSEGKGLKSLVGPLVLQDGIWKVSLKTDGMFTSGTMTNVHGSCYEIIPQIFIVSSASFDAPNEALITTSGGCIGMLQIEQGGGTKWDLTFEPISLTNP